MTKVIHLPSRRAGIQVQPAAQPQAITPDRQAVIENALTMALFFVRQPCATPANVWAATSRANRALTLLKQASAGAAADQGSV